MRVGAGPSLAALVLSLALGCATSGIELPARTTIHLGAGPGLDLGVRTVIVSEDMLVDEATAGSLLVFWLELENHSAAPTRFDPQAIQLVARTPTGSETRSSATASGWGDPPLKAPGTHEPAVDLRPHEQRHAWVMFPLPSSLRDSPAPPSTLILSVDVEGTLSEIRVAGPGGPRWRLPTLGPLHGAISNGVVLAPHVLGDALALRLDVGGFVHVSMGPLVARRSGQSALGVAMSLQVDTPFHLAPAKGIRVTPCLSAEIAQAASSYPQRHPEANISLLGAAAGVEIGFGMLRPANADLLPLEYAWPLSPLSLRLAYTRWLSVGSNDPVSGAGGSGVLATLIVRFAPGARTGQ